MATQTDIPSDLTDDYKAFVFQYLNVELNAGILEALLYGIYTGILAVTLWNISFIENGQNYWTVYLILDGSDAATWVMTATASISTILADLYIIWCCWMVWGQRWLVVLLPIFSLVSAIVSRSMIEYYDNVNLTSPLWDVFFMLYLSSNLVTTLSCTLLIIYRIVAVIGVRHGAMDQLGVFRRFIEVLVESSALYSISNILYLAFLIRKDVRLYYLDAITAIAKVCLRPSIPLSLIKHFTWGVAPTLLVGRAAAGHTRPREDSDRSTVSSLHFQTSSEPGTTSSQHEESTIQSSVLAMDIEAQPEQLVVSVEQDTVVSRTD
ncbi:hypothetical protein ARMSODRAFT_1033800 [Armillaria solidipes]|uniref:Uncharacterized protein n=1 Tax=Armillaria solidipes TaxID=1076256 RepID=A0A2H3BIZ5_9AGAR|nr:hypothetical protein ARMSODRAFT_1033800 [Armillaria solidipes]